MTSFTTPSAQVEALYVGYFGRAAEPAAITYWAGELTSGAMTLEQMAASFSLETEATTRYPYLANPSAADPGAFVDQIYRNLFNHAADAAGKAHWVSQLQASAGTPQAIGRFIVDVMSGATGTDNLALGNKVDVAQDFTTQAANAGGAWNAVIQAQSSLEIAGVNELLASRLAAQAQTAAFFSSAGGPQLTFTLQVDSLQTAQARASFLAPLYATPNGPGQSLQSGDSAIDTGPAGTLVATLNSGINTSDVTLRGIPTATVTSLANGSGFSGNITGLTTLNNSGSTGSLTLGAAGKGLSTPLDTVNISGSGVLGGANTQAFIAASVLAGAADMATVNITGPLGLPTVGGAAQVVLLNDAAPGTAAAPMNGYEIETISSAGAAFVQLSNAASGVLSTSTLYLQGGGAMQLSAGAGGDFANLTTIDASATTGGVTITGLSNSFNAGAAGLLAANTRLTAFTGGSGDDRLDISNMTAAQVGGFTTLSGGAGRDTLVLGAAVGTTKALPNSGFEIVEATTSVAGTVHVGLLGANVDTVRFANQSIATITFDEGYDRAFNIQGPNGATDVLNITDTKGSLLREIQLTGYETVNFTMAENPDLFFRPITARASGDANVTLNFIDRTNGNSTAPDIFIMDSIDVGLGTITFSGTVSPSNGSFGGNGAVIRGPVTAGAIDASGLNVTSASQTGLTMANQLSGPGGATAPIRILGSNGYDVLAGSPGADVISGGGGGGIIVSSLVQGGMTAGDTLTGGSGADRFVLVGAVTSGPLAGLYGTAPTVTDFDGKSADSIRLVPTDFGSYYGNINLQALQGPVTLQVIGSAGSSTISNQTSELVKLSQSVATSGLTLQQAFDAAIGTATVTGATSNGSYFFAMYDTTNSKAAIGIVTATNGTNTVIQAGDSVMLVGSVNMSSADYGQLDSGQFSFNAPLSQF